MTEKKHLTWNDAGILVLLQVGLLDAVAQGGVVVLLHPVVELHLQSCRRNVERSIQR